MADQFVLFKRISVKATGFPWQEVEKFWASDVDGSTGKKWGWNPLNVSGMGRFGGGWAFKLGITASKQLDYFIVDLGLGSFRVKINKGDQS